MDRIQKQSFVSNLKEDLGTVNSLIITHYQGLKVKEITQLRREMHECDAKYKVVKNSLARLAIKDTIFEQLLGNFNGPIAVALSNNPVSVAKTLVKFSKVNEQLSIIGGVVENQLMDLEQVTKLSKLASIEELRAKIIGAINAPASNLVGVLKAPMQQILGVLNAYAKK